MPNPKYRSPPAIARRGHLAHPPCNQSPSSNYAIQTDLCLSTARATFRARTHAGRKQSVAQLNIITVRGGGGGETIKLRTNKGFSGKRSLFAHNFRRNCTPYVTIVALIRPMVVLLLRLQSGTNCAVWHCRYDCVSILRYPFRGHARDPTRNPCLHMYLSTTTRDTAWAEPTSV